MTRACENVLLTYLSYCLFGFIKTFFCFNLKIFESQLFTLFSNFRLVTPDSPIVHIVSAGCAGFVSSTATNPIWFVKTRLQLDYNSQHKMTVRECIQGIYKQSGIRGFYKGITASYFGISETVVHFVIYEYLKRKLVSFSLSILRYLYTNLAFYEGWNARKTTGSRENIERFSRIYGSWRHIENYRFV